MEKRRSPQSHHQITLDHSTTHHLHLSEHHFSCTAITQQIQSVSSCMLATSLGYDSHLSIYRTIFFFFNFLLRSVSGLFNCCISIEQKFLIVFFIPL